MFKLAELLRLKPRKPLRNWVAPQDVVNLLELAGFEPVLTRTRIMFPKQIPFLTTFLNGFVGSVPLINLFALTHWIVARPLPRELDESSVSIVCACRNEQGHIAELIDRVPDFGVPTELIFVEGNSTDDTRGEILRQIEAHPERDIRFVPQTGKGKGDAVRTGFAAAKHDVLMILDGDLSVRPEDLPKFHRGLDGGRELGLKVAREGYCDRQYDDHGNLASRKIPGTVIKDPQAAAKQVVDMVVNGVITSRSGKRLEERVDTLCVHGDEATGVAIARAARDALEAAGVKIMKLTEMTR